MRTKFVPLRTSVTHNPSNVVKKIRMDVENQFSNRIRIENKEYTNFHNRIC